MNEILITLFCVWFAEFSGITINISDFLLNNSLLYIEDNKIRFNKYSDGVKYPVRLLPFNCAKCLTFWSILGYNINEGLYSVIFAGVASLGAIVLSKLLHKL